MQLKNHRIAAVVAGLTLVSPLISVSPAFADGVVAGSQPKPVVSSQAGNKEQGKAPAAGKDAKQEPGKKKADPKGGEKVNPKEDKKADPVVEKKTEVVDNLDALKEQLKEFQKDPVANKDKITELEAKITKLEEQVKPVDDKAVQAKLADLNGKVAAFEEQLNKFQPKDDQKADVEKIKAELAKIKQALKDISADQKSDAKTKMDQLDAQETNFAKLSVAFTQLATPKDENAILTKRLEDLLKRVDAIKASVDALPIDQVDKAVLDKLNQSVKELKQQSNRAKATVSDPKADKADKIKALDALEQKCDELEKQVLAETPADQKEVVKAATQLLKRIADLKFEMKATPADDQEMANAAGKYVKQLEKYEAMVKDILKSKDDVASKTSQLKKLNLEVNKIEDGYAELLGKAGKEVAAKSKAVLAEIDALQAKLDKFEPKTDKQKETKQKLVDQLKALREKVESTVASKTTSKQAKIDALATASKEVKKLDKQADDLINGKEEKDHEKDDKQDAAGKDEKDGGKHGKLAKTGDPMGAVGGVGVIASILSTLGFVGKKKFF